tara:strand:+ start:637 stop:1836 length:1200 start_codon:yes stop_codon:yes gene_type:complete
MFVFLLIHHILLLFIIPSTATTPSSPTPSSNTTADADTATQVAGFQLINILTYVFLCSVMFGIGSGVRIKDLKAVLLKRKAAFVVGLASQYIVVPAAARCVTAILAMEDLDAFVIVLIGCCPGGAVSNAMTYWSKGDLALSVAMTVVSNLLAFATLPLLLLIWTQGFTGRAATVPYLEIFFSLLMVLIPASIGICLRKYNDKWADCAEKIGALGGMFLILASIVAGLASNINTLSDSSLIPVTNVVSVFLVAPIGMLFAFSAILILQRVQQSGQCGGCTGNAKVDGDGVGHTVPMPSMATIVIETGVQNTVLAMAIMTLSFSSTATPHQYFRMQLLVILWGIVVSFEASIVMCIFRMKITKLLNNKKNCDATESGTEIGVKTTTIGGPGTDDALMDDDA